MDGVEEITVLVSEVRSEILLEGPTPSVYFYKAWQDGHGFLDHTLTV
jgi:hypothetical protein